MTHIINGDCLEVLREMDPVDCIFADPPDNIGLAYGREWADNLQPELYRRLLGDWFLMFARKARVVWISFNARHLPAMGEVVARHLQDGGLLADWKFLPCVQTFTFGQHNVHDLGNQHRPLWRVTHPDVKLNPDDIRVESERQKMGDKRANPAGRVPGSVFDFPRVTGNSGQRRPWHPTQLHEGLVERALRLTTTIGDHVLDPFAGTGTTGRVCKRINRRCTLIEINPKFCTLIEKDLNS